MLNCYYVDHEESKTLPRFFPQRRSVDFKLCMDDVTVETLRVMKRLGLSRKDRVQVGDASIAPRDLVVSLLPDPRDLAGRMRGKTCVGTLAKGMKNGEPRAFYIYNVADHETVYDELGVQATAYQTGIPPVIAARLIADGRWPGTGVMLARAVRSRSVPRAAWRARACPGTCGTIRPGASFPGSGAGQSRETVAALAARTAEVTARRHEVLVSSAFRAFVVLSASFLMIDWIRTYEYGGRSR